MAEAGDYGYNQRGDKHGYGSINHSGTYGQPAPYHPGPGQPPSYPPSQSHHTSHNTTVVIQQPQVSTRPPLRAWNTSLCSCFDDMEICCCALFCGSCLASNISKDLGEHCCVPCCVPGAMTALRLKMRMQENIEGSLMDDCCTMVWCGYCGLCQLAREAKFVKKRAQHYADVTARR